MPGIKSFPDKPKVDVTISYCLLAILRKAKQSFPGMDASFLHQAIDSNSDGAVSFSEFKSYLHWLKPSVCLP